MQVQQVTFTAQDLNPQSQSFDDETGKADYGVYTFTGTLYPNGAVSVSYEHCSDGWFDSPENVEACGCDVVTGYEIGESYRLSRGVVRESLKGAVREFGSSEGIRKGFRLLR